MESKNFAKILTTKDRDYLVQKVSNLEHGNGVKITTVNDDIDLSVMISVERKAEIDTLYDNLELSNIETNFNDLIEKLKGLEEE